MKLPFEELNLCRNPFGQLTAKERARLAVVNVDRFVKALQEPGQVFEFFGHSGRGKSTHMRGIWRHFPKAPFLRVAEERERFSIPDRPVIFIDEAQFLTRRQRRKTFTSQRSYVVGTHQKLHTTYRRAGLRFETIELRGITAAKLAPIIESRIEAFRRGPGPIPRVHDDAIHLLIEEFGDNIRAIEGRLYEIFQRLDRPCLVDESFLQPATSSPTHTKNGAPVGKAQSHLK